MTSLREQYLKVALEATMGDRNADYGDPLHQANCAGELKAIFRQYMNRPIGVAELEALDMVFTKISRLITSPKPDTYIDAAAYLAIAGECADRTARGERFAYKDARGPDLSELEKTLIPPKPPASRTQHPPVTLSVGDLKERQTDGPGTRKDGNP